MEEDATPEIIAGLAFPEALYCVVTKEATPVRHIGGNIVTPVSEALDAPGDVCRIQMNSLVVSHALLDLVHSLQSLDLQLQLFQFGHKLNPPYINKVYNEITRKSCAEL